MEEQMPRKVEKGERVIHAGVLRHIEGIGYYIQPNDDETAVVGFPGLDPGVLPGGFKVGDRVKFSMDPDRSGNADTYSKVKPAK